MVFGLTRLDSNTRGEHANNYTTYLLLIHKCTRSFCWSLFCLIIIWSRRGRYRMVVGFITTCAISVNRHYSWQFESRSWRGVLDTTLCDSLLVTCDRPVGFSGYSVSSTNRSDSHYIIEMLLKVALNIITLTLVIIWTCLQLYDLMLISKLWYLYQVILRENWLCIA